ncbi:unnamed protein product [Gordionus sp. m RMFG-2023]
MEINNATFHGDNVFEHLTFISKIISRTWIKNAINFTDTTLEDCQNLTRIAESNRYFAKIYETAGLIVLILGLFGNGLGAYLTILTEHYISPIKNTQSRNSGGTTKKRSRDVNFNIYFMKWFYLINIFNDFTLILSPLMEYFGTQDMAHKKLWYGRAWIKYHAHFHNPIVKPFVVWGFLVYVLYFCSQMIAVKYPFKYRVWMTLRNVRIAMFIALVYSVLWYLPTMKWRIMIKANECEALNITEDINSTIVIPLFNRLKYAEDMDDYSSLFSLGFNESNYLSALGKMDQEDDTFYYYVIYSPGEGRSKVIWIAYQIMRELFTKILPFTIIIVAKIVTIIERAQAMTKVLTATEKRNASTIRSNIKQNSHKTTTLEHVLWFFGKNTKIDVTGNEPESELQNATNSDRLKMTKITSSQKLTLYILTVEFVLLMLPVSVIQMIMDLLIPHHDLNKLLYIYCVLNILEFVYISCTFYINFIFNPYYRHEIVGIIRSKCNS